MNDSVTPSNTNPTAPSANLPELEKLQQENEELRRQRRARLLALFPPEAAATFKPEEYQPVTLEELLAEIHKPEAP